MLNIEKLFRRKKAIIAFEASEWKVSLMDETFKGRL